MKQIKIFYESGPAGIDRLEREVNQWIEMEIIEVVSITPTMCTVGPSEDQYQGMAITVVYEE